MVTTLLITSIASSNEPLVVKSVAVEGTGVRVNLETQVGAPFDSRALERDVQRLWRAGQFEDIRVETAGGTGRTAIIFKVVEAQQWPLHEIRMEPSAFGLLMTLPEGTLVSRLSAHEIALQARQQLRARGYVGARVDYDLARFGGSKVDLRLNILAGNPVHVKEVEFAGDPGLDSKELRGALRTLRPKWMLPGIPRVWRGSRRFPDYNPDAVGSDLAHLRSLYLSKGYFDARVRLDDTVIQGSAARVRVLVQSGPRFNIRDWAGSPTAASFCACLFTQRRDAERQGILDFFVDLDVRRSGDTVTLMSSIRRGRPYRVGRIDLIGAGHYKSATIRRNFVLDEGDLFDGDLLRKSLARLNSTMYFQPIVASNVSIQPNEKTGLTDVRIRLTERKDRAWKLSGPVGPMSLAGPLQASITSRLPSWGTGLLELSTYMVSVSLFAFARPILPILPVTSKGRLLPVFALQRSFSPGEGWRSGFFVAPQLGWRATPVSYAVTQTPQRLLPLLAGDRRLETELPVVVGDQVMFCQPPKPRLALVRNIAAVGVQFLGAMTAIP